MKFYIKKKKLFYNVKIFYYYSIEYKKMSSSSNNLLLEYIVSSRGNYIYPSDTLHSNLFFRKVKKNPYYVFNVSENDNVSVNRKPIIYETKEIEDNLEKIKNTKKNPYPVSNVSKNDKICPNEKNKFKDQEDNSEEEEKKKKKKKKL